jgi:methylthioribose-1-phosphate isomerase
MKSLEWKDGKIRFLDQTKLPEVESFIDTDDPLVVIRAIKDLAIRGAPLIGIAAAYAVALAAYRARESEPTKTLSLLDKTINLLAGTRPTAVNLFWALERQRKVITSVDSGSGHELYERLLREARNIHELDTSMCIAIGKLGADLLPNAAVVLTHCNTGMLATGGIGTALGVIRTSWEQRKLKHVYIDETRPLLQGARLTAWELQKLQIPATLITDSSAAFLMQQGMITTVIVGADRIAANGDVANKIGTYGIAVLAGYHHIPMFVAAPTSTIDFGLEDGKAIPIEQRRAEEITEFFEKRIAPRNTEVYSPAFDITPADCISAIITEQGVMTKPYRESLARLRVLTDPARM